MTYWLERRVLVTGATGIVGSWLCEELLARKAVVTAFVLDEDPISHFNLAGLADQCTLVRGNLNDLTACMRALNNNEIEVIFHLGAQTIVGAALRDPFECFESNVRGTYSLLEAARRLGSMVERIVVASSDKAYGDSPVLPYTEDMPLHGTHPYDVSKSCTDLLSETYARTYGMKIGIARCGNIYGGGDLNWSRIVPGTIRSILLGERPVLRSDGTLIRDYIFVKDVVSAYMSLAHALERDDLRGEAFNFSPETRVNVLQIVREICATMNSDLEPRILGTATHEIRDQTLDSTKARTVLNWTADWSLKAGLAQTVAWYQRHLPVACVREENLSNA